jgi:hypothetical protein
VHLLPVQGKAIYNWPSASPSCFGSAQCWTKLVAFNCLISSLYPPKRGTHLANGIANKQLRDQTSFCPTCVVAHNCSFRSLNSGPACLLSANAATLNLTNQKNGAKGTVIHNDPIFEPRCPVQSLARRATQILLTFTTNLVAPLSACCTQGHIRHTLASHTNTAVKAATKALKSHLCSSLADLVSTHSLRAGGATAMKLDGDDCSTIRKQGQWSSDTFPHVHPRANRPFLLQTDEPTHPVPQPQRPHRGARLLKLYDHRFFISQNLC